MECGSRTEGAHRGIARPRLPSGVAEDRLGVRGKWYSCADTDLARLPAMASRPGPVALLFRLFRQHAERRAAVTLALLRVKTKWRCLGKSHAEPP